MRTGVVHDPKEAAILADVHRMMVIWERIVKALVELKAERGR